ncbi:neo-calmodulin-like [Pecten maximus]|uniref:neo-calmodulin-like n=1 Tax=Pecten maximus TaxID=6579 RepID=UPI0014589F95|nr:neo-calmodulin-like [Pecten maximus]
MGNFMPKKSGGWEGDDRYLQTEFKLMDTDNDGLLSTGQLTNLLLALGFGGDEAQTEMLLKGMNKEREDTLSEEEYVEAVKSNEEIFVKTSKLRVIFGNFDDTNEGKVSKSKIKRRLLVMGFEVDEAMTKAIEETDADRDGFVTYDEFLTKHLKNKGFIQK